MSWLCKNCETLNDDSDNVCLVCNSTPPLVFGIEVDYRKGQISWECTNTNLLTLKYSCGSFDVTGHKSFQIDISSPETVCFIATNDVAERIFRCTLSNSLVQEAIEFKKEEETWDKASRSSNRNDIENYLRLYPAGRHIRAAKNRLIKIEEEEKTIWQSVQESNTESDYIYFINSFPNSTHLSEAQNRLSQIRDDNAWTSVQISNTESDYRFYISHFPTGIHISEAKNSLKRVLEQKDENAWKSAQFTDSIEEYEQYLVGFPNARHKTEARDRILTLRKEEWIREETQWKEACRVNTARLYQYFLQQFPKSKYQNEAFLRLKECNEESAWLNAEGSRSISELDAFINKYPGSKYVQKARRLREEEQAWKNAVSTNTKQAYQKYLNKYPNGIYAQVARNKQASLKSSNSGARVLVVLVLLIIVGGFLYIAYNQSEISSIPEPPRQIEQVETPKSSSIPAISESALKDLESKTESFIKAMEIAKRSGERNADMYNQAKTNLSLLQQYNSSRYYELKKRYDAL